LKEEYGLESDTSSTQFLAETYKDYGRRRHGKTEHSNTGAPIVFGTGANTYDFPPYNNCGAKYDVLSGIDGGTSCADNRMTSAGFNAKTVPYQVTTERTLPLITPAESEYDTWQRI